MRIAGLQKTTLLDYPGKIACTVFLQGCNLRCPYCHNAELAISDTRTSVNIPQPDFFAFLEQRRGKLDGVCISGGEPTIHADLPDLIRRIYTMGFLIKLDTNGTNPDLLEQLSKSGMLQYVAMDIKNAPDRYPESCGGADVLDQVSRSVEFLLRGTVDYEFRTTVCKPLHNTKCIVEIGQWLKGAKRYYLQQFVDSGSLLAGSGLKPFNPEEMEQLRQAVLPFLPNTKMRGI